MSNLVNKLLKFVNNDSPSTSYHKIGPVLATKDYDNDGNYAVELQHNGSYLYFETDGYGNVVMKDACYLHSSDILTDVFYSFEGEKDPECFED